MTSNPPVMDGATDDMSDGTPKNEASDLWEVGREGEIEPPHSRADAETDA